MIRSIVLPCLVALALALGPGAGRAEPLIFEGRIEAAHQAVLATRINGVVAEILFNGGDEVIEGQPLIRLDPARLATGAGRR